MLRMIDYEKHIKNNILLLVPPQLTYIYSINSIKSSP